MLSFVVLPLLVASALAGAILEPVPVTTQEQNTATGEYGYSYSGGPSAKTEYRALDGTTTGSYSYVDAHGILQTVNYIADEFGFRVAGSNIPTEQQHLLRRKRGAVFAPVAPVVHVAPLHPVATSSQSRVDIHKSAHLVTPLVHPVLAPLIPALPHYRKKRGAVYPLAYAAPSHGHFQLHDDAHLVHVAAPLQLHYPLATSSSSRFQIHKNARIVQEFHQPIYAPVAPLHHAIATETHFLPGLAPVAPLGEVVAAAPAASPVAPIHHHPAEAVAALDGDSITVESA